MDCSISHHTCTTVTYSITHTFLCFEMLREPQGGKEPPTLQTQLRTARLKLISLTVSAQLV